MLSVFPDLLTYGIFIPLILRLFLGYYLIKESILNYRRFKSNQIKPSGLILSLAEVAGGVLLVLGLYTQVVAAVFTIFIIGLLLTGSAPNRDFHILLLISFISLLFLGPGAFSIDLPL